jgi:hypothetical protein
VTLQIKNLGYSVKPWRLVTTEGKEFTVPKVFEHPDIGLTVVSECISGNTKQECLEMVLEAFDMLVNENKNLKKQLNESNT